MVSENFKRPNAFRSFPKGFGWHETVATNEDAVVVDASEILPLPRILNEYDQDLSNVDYTDQNTVPLSRVEMEREVKKSESSTCVEKKDYDEEQVIRTQETLEIEDGGSNELIVEKKDCDEEKVIRTRETREIEDRGSNECTVLRILEGDHDQQPGNTRHHDNQNITPIQTSRAKKPNVIYLTIKYKDHDQKQVILTREISLSHNDDHKVEKTLDLFHEIFNKVYEEHVKNSKVLYNKGGNSKVHMDAALILRRKYGWINTSKRIGHVPGIEIGDKFQWMTEMNIVGLHRQFMNGIDYMEKDGLKLATSIVATARYSNLIKSADTLIYSGQGGYPLFKGRGPDRDQKLEKGNLALKNSMEARSPVRVIRGVKKIRPSFFTMGKSGRKIFNSVYVYDGLYYVESYRELTEESGKIVLRFCLKRIPGQPELASVWASFRQRRRL